MSVVIRSLCWAGALTLLALGNVLGLIADQNASVLFAVIPALWVATGGLARCTQGRAGR